jgi:hypothetical protein
VPWERKYARTDGHLLSLLLELKSFESLGCSPGSLEDVPRMAVDRVRSVLRVSVSLTPWQESHRTGDAVANKRTRLGCFDGGGFGCDPGQVRIQGQNGMKQRRNPDEHPLRGARLAGHSIG